MLLLLQRKKEEGLKNKMIIKSVEISNLFSIEKAKVEFSNDGSITLIDGFNYDKETSMGSGKSSIVNCICFGLYGNLPKNLNITNILKRGKKSGYVTVEVQKGNITYSIKRARPNKVTYFKAGVEEAMTQEEFISLLGVTYDQFILGVFFSQSTYGRFLVLNDTAKKDFITKLQNINKISKFKEISDKKAKEIRLNIADFESKKSYLDGQISMQKSNISELEEIKASIDKQNKELKKMEEEYGKIPTPQKADTTELDILEEKVNKKLHKISEEKGAKNSIEYRTSHLEAEIANPSWERGSISLSCPSCDTLIKMDKDGSIIKNKEHLIENLKKELEEAKKSLADIISKSTDDSEKMQDIIKKIKNKRAEILEKYNKDSQYKIYLENEINLMRVSIRSLIQNKDRLEQISNEINTLINKFKKLASQIEEENKSKEVYETISSIFSPTGLPAYITNNSIELFNNLVKKYIDILWDNVEYKIIAYKENSKGEIVAKYNDLLMVDGQEVPLGTFSGGEFRILSLAVDMAVVDLLETSLGFSISPIFLDEAFDGLDNNYKEKVVEMLQGVAIEKDKEIVVIDHSSEFKSLFNRVIFCKKNNNITVIS